MTARHLGIALLLLGVCTAMPTQAADDYISYEAPSVSIDITPKTLKQVEQVAEYDDPLSTRPSRIVTITKEAELNPQAFEELARDIEQTNFFALGEQYGASEGGSTYPYTISVRYRNKARTVTYRSAGDDTKRPAAFGDVQALITRFSRRVTARAR
jgi:hypothetical protein